MFAIIKTGGKQYKVTANEIIKVEKLAGASGDAIEFTDILMMGQGDSVKVGAPFVTSARVCGTIVDQIRDDKVIIFKKKRRHNYRRKNGHRQYLSVVRITDILGEGDSPKEKATSFKETAPRETSEKKVLSKGEAKPAKARVATAVVEEAKPAMPPKAAAAKVKKSSEE
ncbi:MAG: 50S ribosomal protein L21 [Alphaproteobacteria bacterium]|nr:50S ribosomal protein L21 [Alphaproteobacteria bacterium]